MQTLLLFVNAQNIYYEKAKDKFSYTILLRSRWQLKINGITQLINWKSLLRTLKSLRSRFSCIRKISYETLTKQSNDNYNNNNNNDYPHSCSSSTRFLVEFGNVGFWGEGKVKTGVAEEKPLLARERTNNRLNRHMASTPGFEPGSHWWEESSLITAPPLLPYYWLYIVSGFKTTYLGRHRQKIATW